MNEYINNFNSHSPTKWSHYYYFLTSLMKVSCLMSSYCFCNAQLFITNPNPNPETAFFQKSDKPQPRQHVLLTPIWICAFLHAYLPHPASHPHPALFLGILLFDAFENVYYFVLHIIMSAAISICHFNCVRLEKYCHLGEGTFYLLFAPTPLPPVSHSLPPSGWVSETGAKILFGPFWQSPTPAPRFSDTHLK